MAGEEDVELRDLVAQTLEAKGVLGKIRAQLRSSVFLALEEQESKEKNHPLVNQRLQKYLKTKEGQLATSLVREFLEFFELDFTCAVFDPETNVLETYPGRDRLAKEVGLESQASTSCPLLASVLQRATQSPMLHQLRFPDLGPIVTTASTHDSTPSSAITESGRTIVSTLADTYSHVTSTRVTSTSASTFLDAHKTRSEATTMVTSSVKTIPSTSVSVSTGAPSLGTSLNTNENSNLRLEPRAAHPNVSSRSALNKPASGLETTAELGTTFMNSTLDIGTLLNSGEEVEKLLKQARGRESSKDELDDFFDTPLPSAFDEMKETRPSRPPLEDALGATGMSKKLDPLSSLKDAPTLTASSLQGAPPLGATSSGNLVGKKGSLGNKPHLLLDGGSNEYDDDFDSEGGETISEQIETPSSSKLTTRDSTFSDTSFGCEFDHIEKVES